MTLKTLLYAAARGIGGFRLASRLTSKDLRILCYHGVSFTDEHLFRPKLFQTFELFEMRMRYLKHAGYRTLSLDDAMPRLRDGLLTSKDLVITIDDGFYGIYALAAPLLRELGFGATIYVTTYYVERNNPIFRLALQYIFWKTVRNDIESGDLMRGLAPISPTRGDAGNTLLWTLIRYGETQVDESGRMALAREVARRLDVDFEELVSSRRLTLMKGDEIAALAGQGFDIQLHTHRHQLPEDGAGALRELADNRNVLEPLVGKPLNHLCYPSGEWTPAMWASLEDNAVQTATTCQAGLNTPSTPPFALHRFLDFQTTPQIVFEAEVSGFANVLRSAVGR